MYVMRGVNKTQMINAHQGRVKALAFDPDDKTLTSSSSENWGILRALLRIRQKFDLRSA